MSGGREQARPRPGSQLWFEISQPLPWAESSGHRPQAAVERGAQESGNSYPWCPAAVWENDGLRF